MARVVLENLTKIYPGVRGESIHAVTNVDLTISDKEFLVLLGPSGCGKTTTLRLIAGLEEITQGRVLIDDKVVNEIPAKDRDVAMVFQNHALYPHMTAYDNIAFGLKLRRFSKSEIQRRVHDAAEILSLADCLDRRPGALSGGQRQRVAVARAIVRQPKVFLFDEPLANLDAPMRARMRSEISRLHARFGWTMIYVTHDQVEAMTMGDPIALMRQGVIQQVGSPTSIYHQPANRFVAGFIGAPPMNFFEGTIVQRGDTLFFEEQSGNGAVEKLNFRLENQMAVSLNRYAGKPIVFGIRPENIAAEPSLHDAPADRAVQAVVETVEPLGAETHLHLTSAAHTFVARVRATDSLRVSQRVPLAFEMSHAHFFDAQTGKAIV